MLFIILAVIAAVAFFYCFIVKPMNYWKYNGVTQGNPQWIFGHTFKVIFRFMTWADFVQQVYNQSPGTRYTGMYNFHFPILVIKDPELLKQLGIKDFDHFTDHISLLPPDTDPLFEKSLLSLTGRKWREMRTMLSPAFTSSKMRLIYGLMVETTENFVKYFKKKDEELITVDMKDVFSHFASDVIATTAWGLKVDSLEEPNNEFYMVAQEAVDFSDIWKNIKLILYKMIPPVKNILKVQLFSDEVSNYFRSVIETTIRAREENGVVRPDVIHLLLEARKGIVRQEDDKHVDTGFATADDSFNKLVKEKVTKTLTNEDIIAQAVTFFIAGFDTVSSLMCFITYELAVNQDIQDRLREEVNDTWKKCGGNLTYQTLLGMKYLDMVISESLRKWPIQVAVDRQCTKPYTIEPSLPGESPIHLKEGDPIWFPILAIHRDPNNYPEPDRFDPERFSDENKGSINPYTYLPFGIGPRGCIGSRFGLLEAKVITFYILLNFELVPVEKTQIPLKISKKSFAMTAEGGFWLGLKKIKNT